MKTYQVTISPKITSYGGSYTDSRRTVRVVAESRNEAISQVRRERRSEEGRYGVAATYTAKETEPEGSWDYNAPVRDEFGTNEDEYGGGCWWK